MREREKVRLTRCRVLQHNSLHWHGHVWRNDWMKKSIDWRMTDPEVVKWVRGQRLCKKNLSMHTDWTGCYHAIDHSWWSWYWMVDDHDRCEWGNCSSGTCSPGQLRINRHKMVYPRLYGLLLWLYSALKLYISYSGADGYRSTEADIQRQTERERERERESSGGGVGTSRAVVRECRR